MRGLVRFLFAVMAAFFVTSASAITITSQPKTATVNSGSTATFSVVTTNGTVTGYQWIMGTTPLQDGTTNGAIITGSQTATLTIENVGTNLNAKLFKAAVSNSGPTISSLAAKLTVLQGTLVKFDTSLGPIVIELFDHDKPVTVQNFIRYANGGPNSGAYLNAFFTRLEKNFVLQGGGFGPIAGSGGDLFTNEYYIPLAAYEQFLGTEPGFPWIIVNESHVGPHVRNTFGTVAMATVFGYPNSAHSEFFFNLADNSSGSTNLDEINGGYAVFARVVQGFDVLTNFNNLPSEQIVSHSVADSYYGTKTFPTLPTKTTDTNNVHVNDLYFTSISLLTRPYFDLSRPTAKILYPLPNAKLTNGNFTLRGIASDNLGISSILCTKCLFLAIGPDPVSQEISGGLTVNGTTNWSVDLQLHPGPWSLTFRVIDGFGNWVPLTLNITVTDPLTVQTNGKGKITPSLNRQYLSPESKYAMTAVANPGQLFAYWTAVRNGQPWNFPYGSWGYVNMETNGTNSLVLTGPSLGYQVTTPTLSFFMYSNLTVTANFVSNYFPVVQGTYYGLVAPTDHDNITVTNAGMAKITSTSVGSFTGTLSIQGKTLPFLGKWDYAGNATVSIPRAGMGPLTANLSIDLTNNLESITGTITSTNWQADIAAYRGVTKLTTNTTPAIGSYVMRIPSVTSDLGDSYATVNVSATGLLTFSGLMSDNTMWTETVGVAKDGSFPLFCSLYAGKGLIIGSQQFTTPTNSSGSYTHWIRPAITTAYYTNGFSTPAFSSYMSRFTRPAVNTPFVLQFGGNTFPATFSYGLKFNARGGFDITNGGGPGDKLVLTLVPTTGALTGTWTDPVMGTWTIKGILGTFNNPSIDGNGFILGPHGQTGFMQLFLPPP